MDMDPTPPSLPEVRRALARSIGLAAFVYGYPLIETYRTCRLQTDAGAARATGLSVGLGLDMRGDFDTLHHSQRPSTHEDRDVVTPANDLLYSLAWIHLRSEEHTSELHSPCNLVCRLLLEKKMHLVAPA